MEQPFPRIVRNAFIDLTGAPRSVQAHGQTPPPSWASLVAASLQAAHATSLSHVTPSQQPTAHATTTRPHPKAGDSNGTRMQASTTHAREHASSHTTRPTDTGPPHAPVAAPAHRRDGEGGGGGEAEKHAALSAALTTHATTRDSEIHLASAPAAAFLLPRAQSQKRPYAHGPGPAATEAEDEASAVVRGGGMVQPGTPGFAALRRAWTEQQTALAASVREYDDHKVSMCARVCLGVY